MKIKLEYIWLDGYQPEPNLRSKVKVLDFDQTSIENGLALVFPKLQDIPEWSFDGSSTQQAEGQSSDCILKPVKLYSDPLRGGFSYLVMCEVMNPDGTPHSTNTRAKIKQDNTDNWFGFEQEYVLRWFNKNQNSPLGFENFNPPEAQGKYYCSVGHPYSAGREITEEHMDACLSCGINITGTNAEVMLGQWEYQVFAKGNKNAGDDLWVSRFILNRIAEKYRVKVDYHPKPMGKEEDWNGSGMHVNFSNGPMRELGGKELFENIFEMFGEKHEEAISIYGSDNDQRLTGNHETQSIDKFSWGVSDRGASIRVPITTAKDWIGYLEDRRPGSNADPYLITSFIGDILQEVSTHSMNPQGK
jgi:glutamine synthetase